MWDDYEEFDDEQLSILKPYVSNLSGNVFVLSNLPEVIKGALFSRYSRSTLGLRSLLLKEFIKGDDSRFVEICGEGGGEDQSVEIAKAQRFYDRILDNYGDDSIGELGGAHIAFEQVSMLAAKELEHPRIGGSPLEKSTRYVYFDQKLKGEYLFYREPMLMASAHRNLYIDTCNMLFKSYSSLVPPLTERMENAIPRKEGVSQAAYAASIRAKVLDCLRGLLPAGTLTNVGIYGNGRFYEGLVQKMQSHNLAELQGLGERAYTELSKVIPSFVRRAEPTHRHYKGFQDFREKMTGSLQSVAGKYTKDLSSQSTQEGAKLLFWDPFAATHVAAALLFPHCSCDFSLLLDHCQKLPRDDIEHILEAACSARGNRRHKSPRALEHCFYTFEIVADFATYRDLQRHRMLTQDRQILTCSYGYYFPSELLDTDLEAPYRKALEEAENAYTCMARDLPEEAQYVVPMAYNMRWNMCINLRALQWMCELRSAPQGHERYRSIVQEMAKQVCTQNPEFSRFFDFVDYEDYDLGRLQQEIRSAEKKGI